MNTPAWILGLPFIVSLLVTLAVVLKSRGQQDHSRWHRWLRDHDMAGPQKFHAHPVPRVGGAGVALGLLALCLWADAHNADGLHPFLLLWLAALPVVVFGLAEDLTKRVSALWRLMATFVSALLALGLLGIAVVRTDIPGLDTLAQWAPASVALTCLVVGGTAHAINIIDGFNGLASMCAMLMLAAIAYVAWQVGDTFVMQWALACLAAVFGFFIFNYPAGLIFLGDGGAYLVGFVLAELILLLVQRNPSVSPIFGLLVCAYPIFELVFSMYRRKFLHLKPSMAPDGIHLHSLIYRRLIRWAGGELSPRQSTYRNSMTSPFLWALCLLSIVPAIIWWQDSLMLGLFLFLFMGSYLFMYARITRFKTPAWLKRFVPRHVPPAAAPLAQHHDQG